MEVKNQAEMWLKNALNKLKINISVKFVSKNNKNSAKFE